MELKPEILLSHPIPKPLWGINPRTIMGTKAWRELCSKVHEEWDYRCAACGHPSKMWYRINAGFEESKNHDVHETYRISYKRGIIRLNKVYPLCSLCHMYCHPDRLESLPFKDNTVYRGMVLLREAGYAQFRPSIPDWRQVPWEQWYLEYKGKKYYSNWDSEEQYEEAQQLKEE